MRQVLVEIQDDVLERMRNGEHVIYDLVGAVMNGTVLPEHHGRLIDADAYIASHAEFGWLDDIAVDEFNKITPTIIPATKEGDAQ